MFVTYLPLLFLSFDFSGVKRRLFSHPEPHGDSIDIALTCVIEAAAAYPNWNYLPLKTHFANSNFLSLTVWVLRSFLCSVRRRPKLSHTTDGIAVGLILPFEFKD